MKEIDHSFLCSRAGALTQTGQCILQQNNESQEGYAVTQIFCARHIENCVSYVTLKTNFAFQYGDRSLYSIYSTDPYNNNQGQ